MDGEKRECDEMMIFLAVGMQSLITSSSESTPPPYGEKEPHRLIQLIIINGFYPLESVLSVQTPYDSIL